MREIRTSGSMSGDGKRDQYAPGVQSTRARPRLYRAACHSRSTDSGSNFCVNATGDSPAQCRISSV